MTTYNGWTNRQTWNVHLWLSNDEPLYRMALDAAKPRRTLADAAAAIRTMCNDLWPSGRTPDNDSLRGVNWREVASAFRE
jgi:hypothetical protein